MRPATTSAQRCDEFHVRIDPETRVSRHIDYFGTEVLEFGVPTAHEHLTIDVRARVVTSEPPDPPEGPWNALTSSGYVEAAGEFLLPWQDDGLNGRLDELEAAMRADHAAGDAAGSSASSSPTGSSTAAARRTSARPSPTCSTSAPGVCQDFVHLALVLLRRQGIAARYVSGYLWAAPEDGGSDSLEVDTHAWLEALLPGTDGRGEPVWVGADPTNRRLASETHVKIGHGRFYADVPPVKGVYRGPATSDLDAAVTMSRLDPQAGARA